MYKYEIVTVEARKGLNYFHFEENAEIIKKYAAKGYRYVGYLPASIFAQGGIRKLDLIFEKEE